MKRFRLLLLLAGSLLTGSMASAAQLMVFAAASLSDVLQQLAPAYTAQTGHTVRFNFAGSGALLRQVGAGAPADVFISADSLRVDQLESAGLALSGSRRDLVTNQLVLIIDPALATVIRSTADLTKPEVRRLAIGEPATVPVGTYTKIYLQRERLWSPLLDKMVPLESVRAVLSAVAAGNAEAGFVYRTDARSTDTVRVVQEVPSAPDLQIVYPGAVVRESKHPEAAQAFLEFLLQPQAQAVFVAAGFGRPNPADSKAPPPARRPDQAGQ